MSAVAEAATEPHEETEDRADLAAVPDEAADLLIEGDGQITLIAGGQQADQSTIVFRGGEVHVSGEFEKGTRVKFEIEGVVSEITFTDLMDRKTGDVTATKRKHVMKLDGIKRVED